MCTNGHLISIPEFHNVLIVKTKVPKINHISNLTTNPTPIDKYIETQDTTKQNTKPSKTNKYLQNKIY